jgi:hypothetical protein
MRGRQSSPVDGKGRAGFLELYIQFYKSGKGEAQLSAANFESTGASRVQPATLRVTSQAAHRLFIFGADTVLGFSAMPSSSQIWGFQKIAQLTNSVMRRSGQTPPTNS